MPTVLNNDCLGIVYEFLAKPHLETAIAHQIAAAAEAGEKQNRQFIVWNALKTDQFTIRIQNDLFPAHFGGGHRKLCVIILWHGPGMTPYDCTFHKRRDAGTNLHEEIFRVYDGREKGDLKTMLV